VTTDFAEEAASVFLLTAAYPDAPRITIVSSQINTETLGISIDLLRHDIRTQAAPGQAEAASASVQLLYGIASSIVEQIVMDRLVDITGGELSTSIGTPKIFETANESGIELVVITPHSLSKLEQLDISDEAKARVTAAIEREQIAIVPAQMVLVNGSFEVGWYEIDPVTGRTISVSENGLHNSTWESLIVTLNWFAVIYAPVGFFGGFMAGIFAGFHLSLFLIQTPIISVIGFISALLALIGLKNTDLVERVLRLIFTAISTGITYPLQAAIFAELLPGVGIFLAFTLTGFFLGFIAGLVGGTLYALKQAVGIEDPPLPPWNYSNPLLLPPDPDANIFKTVAFGATYSATNPVRATLTSSHASISGTVQTSWSTNNNDLHFSTLSASVANLYDAMGTLLGSGAIQTTPLTQPVG
jgi:hypothetical protein